MAPSDEAGVEPDPWLTSDVTVAASDIHVRYNVASGAVAAGLSRTERAVRRLRAR